MSQDDVKEEAIELLLRHGPLTAGEISDMMYDKGVVRIGEEDRQFKRHVTESLRGCHRVVSDPEGRYHLVHQ